MKNYIYGVNKSINLNILETNFSISYNLINSKVDY